MGLGFSPDWLRAISAKVPSASADEVEWIARQIIAADGRGYRRCREDAAQICSLRLAKRDDLKSEATQDCAKVVDGIRGDIRELRPSADEQDPADDPAMYCLACATEEAGLSSVLGHEYDLPPHVPNQEPPHA